MNILSARLSKSIEIKSRYRLERATHMGCKCAKMRRPILAHLQTVCVARSCRYLDLMSMDFDAHLSRSSTVQWL